VGGGRQPGETELPDDSAGMHRLSAPCHCMLTIRSAPAVPQFKEAALAQLERMGFPLIRCQNALLATGNNDAEAAMEWLFAHMEDPGWYSLSHSLLLQETYPLADIDAPLELGQAEAAPQLSADQIAMLVDMGFTSAHARKALRETVR
jgi:ubiquitin carboxyl-terminal hydrolase 5/13